MNSHPATLHPLTTRLYAGEPDLLAMYDLLVMA
jgi:hypothetical protein